MIEVENIQKRYKVKVKKGFLKDFFRPDYTEIRAVDDISFSIKSGELVGFIGPNGAGKTTTIKMLTGILWPSSGSIYINNINPAKERKTHTKTIGVVFGQRKSLWPELSVYDNIELIGSFYGLSKKHVHARVKELQQLLNLDDFFRQPFRKLSLGQQMKCELVSALIHKPKILFLDEPTIGMDIIAKSEFIALLKNINQTQNTTILLTSHDLAEIEQLCKRIIIINNGLKVYDGLVESIRPDEVVVQYQSQKGLIEKRIKKQKLAQFLQNKDISSLRIHEIPLEEIIRKLYQKKQLFKYLFKTDKKQAKLSILQDIYK